jgi:hypothetical protein
LFCIAGFVVVHVVSSSSFAQKSEAAGCDAVVAEGFEAGGHNGREETTTMVMHTQVDMSMLVYVALYLCNIYVYLCVSLSIFLPIWSIDDITYMLRIGFTPPSVFVKKLKFYGYCVMICTH